VQNITRKVALRYAEEVLAAGAAGDTVQRKLSALTRFGRGCRIAVRWLKASGILVSSASSLQGRPKLERRPYSEEEALAFIKAVMLGQRTSS
jgi:hypothetical protein